MLSLSEVWFPNVRNPSAQALNNLSDALHMNYFDFGLDDADMLRYSDPGLTITYLMKPTRSGRRTGPHINYSTREAADYLMGAA